MHMFMNFVTRLFSLNKKNPVNIPSDSLFSRILENVRHDRQGKNSGCVVFGRCEFNRPQASAPHLFDGSILRWLPA